MLTRKRQKKSVWLKIITEVVIIAMVCENIAWAYGDFGNWKSGERDGFSLKRDTFIKDPGFKHACEALEIIDLLVKTMGKDRISISNLRGWGRKPDGKEKINLFAYAEDKNILLPKSTESVFKDTYFRIDEDGIWIHGQGWKIRFFNPKKTVRPDIKDKKFGEKQALNDNLAYQIYLTGGEPASGAAGNVDSLRKEKISTGSIIGIIFKPAILIWISIGLGIIGLVCLVTAGYLYWINRKGLKTARKRLDIILKRPNSGLERRVFKLKASNRESEYKVYENNKEIGTFRVRYNKKDILTGAQLKLGKDRYRLTKEEIENLKSNGKFLKERRGLLINLGILALGGAMVSSVAGRIADRAAEYIIKSRFSEIKRPVSSKEMEVIKEMMELALKIEEPQLRKHAINFVNCFIDIGRIIDYEDKIIELNTQNDFIKYSPLDNFIEINYQLYKLIRNNEASIQGAMVHEGKHIEDKESGDELYIKYLAVEKIRRNLDKNINSIDADGDWEKFPGRDSYIYELVLLDMFLLVNIEARACIEELKFYKTKYGDLREYIKGFRPDPVMDDYNESKKIGLIADDVKREKYAEYLLKRYMDLIIGKGVIKEDGSIDGYLFKRNYIERVLRNIGNIREKFLLQMVLYIEYRRGTIEKPPGKNLGYNVTKPDKFLDWIETGMFVDEEGNKIDLMKIDLSISPVKEKHGRLDRDTQRGMDTINPAPRAKARGFGGKLINTALHPCSKERGFTGGGVNLAIATQGMYTEEEHNNTNRKIEDDITNGMYAKLRIQNGDLKIAEKGYFMDLPEDFEKRKQKIWESLDEETKKALADVSLFLLPPENKMYPYYLRTEMIDGRSEYQVAHAGSYKGKAKNVFMTKGAFMELPIKIIVRILKREAGLARKRCEERFHGKEPEGSRYDEEVASILKQVEKKYLKLRERYERVAIPIRLLDHVGQKMDLSTYLTQILAYGDPDQIKPRLEDMFFVNKKDKKEYIRIHDKICEIYKQLYSLWNIINKKEISADRVDEMEKIFKGMCNDFIEVFKRYSGLMGSLGDITRCDIFGNGNEIKLKDGLMAFYNKVNKIITGIFVNFQKGGCGRDYTGGDDIVNRGIETLDERLNAEVQTWIRTNIEKDIDKNAKIYIDNNLFPLALGMIFGNEYDLKDEKIISKIKISIKKDEDSINIVVEDDGKGFDEDLLERSIFTDRQNVFVLDITKRDRNSGTGLGLAFLWYAVKDHDGDIKISNKSSLRDGGAKFEINIPIVNETQVFSVIKNPAGYGKSTYMPPSGNIIRGEESFLLAQDEIERSKEPCIVLEEMYPGIMEKLSMAFKEARQGIRVNPEFDELLQSLSVAETAFEKNPHAGFRSKALKAKGINVKNEMEEDFYLGGVMINATGKSMEFQLAVDLMDDLYEYDNEKGTNLLAEYIFHEATCWILGHGYSRLVQSITHLFCKNYMDGESLLAKKLRERININVALNGFNQQIVDEESERFVNEAGVILMEAIEKYPPKKPGQCIYASRYICDRLNKMPDVIALERGLFIPSDCSLSTFTGTTPKSYHTIVEIKYRNKYYVVDAQLFQFKYYYKLNLPDKFINQYIYTPEEYYSNVPCFRQKHWREKWKEYNKRIDGPFLPKFIDELKKDFRKWKEGYREKGKVPSLRDEYCFIRDINDMVFRLNITMARHLVHIICENTIFTNIPPGEELLRNALSVVLEEALTNNMLTGRKLNLRLQEIAKEIAMGNGLTEEEELKLYSNLVDIICPGSGGIPPEKPADYVKYKEIISHYRKSPDVVYETRGYDEESARFAAGYMQDIISNPNMQYEITEDLFVLINNKNIPEEPLRLLFGILFKVMDIADEKISEELKELIYQGINNYLAAQKGFRDPFFSELIKYFDNPESDNFRKRMIEYIEKNMKALVGLGYCHKIIGYFINHLKSKRLSIAADNKLDLEIIMSLMSLMELISKFEYIYSRDFKMFRRELVWWHLNHPEERVRDYSLECLYQINENLAKSLGFHPGQNELLRSKIEFHSEYYDKDILAKRHINLTKIRDILKGMVSSTNLIKDSLLLIHDKKILDEQIDKIEIQYVDQGGFKDVHLVKVHVGGTIYSFVIKRFKAMYCGETVREMQEEVFKLIKGDYTYKTGRIYWAGDIFNYNSLPQQGNFYDSKEDVFYTEEFIPGYMLQNLIKVMEKVYIQRSKKVVNFEKRFKQAVIKSVEAIFHAYLTVEKEFVLYDSNLKNIIVNNLDGIKAVLVDIGISEGFNSKAKILLIIKVMLMDNINYLLKKGDVINFEDILRGLINTSDQEGIKFLMDVLEEVYLLSVPEDRMDELAEYDQDKITEITNELSSAEEKMEILSFQEEIKGFLRQMDKDVLLQLYFKALAESLTRCEVNGPVYSLFDTVFFNLWDIDFHIWFKEKLSHMLQDINDIDIFNQLLKLNFNEGIGTLIRIRKELQGRISKGIVSQEYNDLLKEIDRYLQGITKDKIKDFPDKESVSRFLKFYGLNMFNLKRRGVSIEKYQQEFKNPIGGDDSWARVSASMAEAKEFHEKWKRKNEGEINFDFKGQEYYCNINIIRKIKEWAIGNRDLERAGVLKLKYGSGIWQIVDFIPEGTIAHFDKSSYSEGRSVKIGCRRIGDPDYIESDIALGFYNEELEVKREPGFRYVDLHTHIPSSNYPTAPSPDDQLYIWDDLGFMFSIGTNSLIAYDYDSKDSQVIYTLDDKEKKQRVLGTFKNLERILKMTEGNNFEAGWSRLSGLTQNIYYADRLQLVIPINVLKTLPDVVVSLQKMSLLGRGGKQVEFIIYDLDSEHEAQEIKDLLKELITSQKDASNIRIHTVTKKRLSDFNGEVWSMPLTDKINILNSFLNNPDNYPLEKDEYRLIVTDEIEQKELDLALSEMQKGFKQEGNNTFIRILESRGGGRIFSLSNILINWLDCIGKTKGLTDKESISRLLINIISPIQISPKDLEEEIESQLTQAWKLLTSA